MTLDATPTTTDAERIADLVKRVQDTFYLYYRRSTISASTRDRVITDCYANKVNTLTYTGTFTASFPEPGEHEKTPRHIDEFIHNNAVFTPGEPVITPPTAPPFDTYAAYAAHVNATVRRWQQQESWCSEVDDVLRNRLGIDYPITVITFAVNDYSDSVSYPVGMKTPDINLRVKINSMVRSTLRRHPYRVNADCTCDTYDPTSTARCPSTAIANAIIGAIPAELPEDAKWSTPLTITTAHQAPIELTVTITSVTKPISVIESDEEDDER